MSFLLLLAGFLNNSYANDELKYKDVKKGQVVQFDGKLFTNAAIAKILSDHELELDKCKINNQAAIETLEKDWQLKYTLLEKKNSLEKDLYNSLIKNRDDFIKENTITNADKYSNLRFIGGVLVGASIAVGVAYSLDNLHH